MFVCQGDHVQSAHRNAIAMVQDGIAPKDVRDFATCGNSGVQQGHIERDLHTWMKLGRMLEMEPYQLRIKLKNIRTNGTSWRYEVNTHI